MIDTSKTYYKLIKDPGISISEPCSKSIDVPLTKDTGILFTDRASVHLFLHKEHSRWIAKVKIPDDSNIITEIDNRQNRYWTDKITIVKHYVVESLDTIRLLNLDISTIVLEQILEETDDKVPRGDFIKFINWVRSNIGKIQFNRNINSVLLAFAAKSGDKNIKYILKNPVQTIDIHKAVIEASKAGQTKSLDQLYKFGISTESVVESLEEASSLGKIESLNWFLSKGLIPDNFNTAHCIELACELCRLDVLNWWKSSGVTFSYTETILNDPETEDEFDYLDVLIWYKNSGLELKYTERAIETACSLRWLRVLDWWKDSGLELKYTNKCIDKASYFGHTDVLQWWKDSGLELKYTVYALSDIYDQDIYLKSADWWKKSGLPGIEIKMNLYEIEILIVLISSLLGVALYYY